jgi:hypothetical protein
MNHSQIRFLFSEGRRFWEPGRSEFRAQLFEVCGLFPKFENHSNFGDSSQKVSHSEKDPVISNVLDGNRPPERAVWATILPMKPGLISVSMGNEPRPDGRLSKPCLCALGVADQTWNEQFENCSGLISCPVVIIFRAAVRMASLMPSIKSPRLIPFSFSMCSQTGNIWPVVLIVKLT